MNDARAILIILTHSRPQLFQHLIDRLGFQTNKNIDILISDSSGKFEFLEYAASTAHPALKLKIEKATSSSVWRRIDLARDAAKAGYEKVLFLDDDIFIPNNYIERALAQYEPKSYKSWWAWNLNGGYHYLKDRTRVLSIGKKVNYCGAGASIMDASLFLEDGVFDVPVDDIKQMDDIWLSYYTDHVLKWKLEYLDIANVQFMDEAESPNALYKLIGNKSITAINKKEAVDLLKTKHGWDPR